MAKNNKQEKTLSLREKIKAYRRELHGEAAKKFDTVFLEAAGGSSLKEALQDGMNLQKAFVAAKKEAERLSKEQSSEE